MPRFLATYDLKGTDPDPHGEFLNQAQELGWTTWIRARGQKVWSKLPNTTLVGRFPTREIAVAEFKKIAVRTRRKGFRVVVEKYIVVASGGLTFYSDEKSAD